MELEIHDDRDSLFAIPQYYHVAATKLIDDGNENGIELYKKAIKDYETFLAHYSNEPDWDVYLAYFNLAFAYEKMGKYENSAKMFDWIANMDTTEYGERPINLIHILPPENAAYNAVLMMDLVREQAQKQLANNDPIKAYELSETKAYFEQVEKYLAMFGDRNEAVELAKKFGQDESFSFVNGILAKFTK